MVPGHTRGIITINEGRVCGSACCRTEKKPVDAPSAPLNSKNCAVCAAAAKLGAQIVAVPPAHKWGSVNLAVLPVAGGPPPLAPLLTLQPRGPPIPASHFD